MRSISYDHRGHGASRKAPRWTYIISSLSDDLHNVLTALRVAPPLTVVGRSMGAMAALSVLSRPTGELALHPQRPSACRNGCRQTQPARHRQIAARAGRSPALPTLSATPLRPCCIGCPNPCAPLSLKPGTYCTPTTSLPCRRRRRQRGSGPHDPAAARSRSGRCDPRSHPLTRAGCRTTCCPGRDLSLARRRHAGSPQMDSSRSARISRRHAHTQAR